MTVDAFRALRGSSSRQLSSALVIAAFALALNAPLVPAKQVVDYFGTDPAAVLGSKGGEFRFPGGVAVNQGGAGPADAGDVYVLDQGGFRQPWPNRVQRFHRDDNGTPANPYDDEWEFVSAWGADVVKAGGAGDLGDAADAIYEICTVAEQCQQGVASGGNGSASGNGALARPTGIALDQDTGRVYVADSLNHRVNVYAGDGVFVRSFGWDVIAPGSPGDLPHSERQTVTLGANTTGGSFGLGIETAAGSGTFLDTNTSADVQNTITDVEVDVGEVQVGDEILAASAGLTIPVGTTVTAVDPAKRTVTLSKEFDLNTIGDWSETHRFTLHETAVSIPHNAPATGPGSVQAALETLPGIEPGDVLVSGAPSGPYELEFAGAFADADIGQTSADASGLTVSSGTKSVAVATAEQGASYEVCEAGEVCQTGSPGLEIGQLGGVWTTTPESTLLRHPEPGIALSPPDGNPASGTAFVADLSGRRVGTYDLDGGNPGGIGSAALFSAGYPGQVAIDSRGIVYATNGVNEQQIERYDSQGVHGPVGFLAPIAAGVDEVQEVKIAATAGTFRLTFDPDEGGPLPAKTSADIPYNAFAGDKSFRAGLEEVFGSSASASGGPGDAAGSKPYKITLRNTFGAADVPELTASNGSVPLSGGAGASVTTVVPGQPGLLPASTDSTNQATGALAVDPDSDGAGADTDVLYVGRSGIVQQFGPLNDPGLAAPPVGQDDQHSSPLGEFNSGPRGLGVDETGERVYASSSIGAGQSAHGVYVIGEGGPAPEAQIDSIADVTDSSATVDATIDPNGPPPVSYRFEYSLDGAKWTPLPERLLGVQEDPQQVEEVVSPPGTGLQPSTFYHVRLRATKAFTEPVLTAAETFTTDPSAPQVETVGSPLRTSTTAQLAGRVNPRGDAASFHFEFVTEAAFQATGFNDLSSGGETAPQPAGSGNEIQLVVAEVGGLAPDTAYRYRVVADNGNPGSPVIGEAVTIATRTSDEPLSHGELPGPPGSDRAYEQVNVPETGGNPVVLSFSAGFSEDGERALYGVAGGTPLTDTGTVFSQFFAERTPSGWQPRLIYPRREQLKGPNWLATVGDAELDSLFSYNFELGVGVSQGSFFRFGPGSAPETVYDATQGAFESFFAGSADGSRLVAALEGAPDPGFPGATATNLYELASGTAHLVSVLPGDVIAACGVAALPVGGPSIADYTQHWVSHDGGFALFPSKGNDCGSNEQLYARDLAAGETELVSGPPLSGSACAANLIKSTPGAVFFRTGTRLSAEDEALGCGQSVDVYRYDLQDKTLECVTCVVEGLAASPTDVGVAPDGSRVYFRSSQRLVSGAAPGGTYRVGVASGDLAYVGYLGDANSEGIADNVGFGQALNANGSVAVFRSDEPFLNPLGEGHDNGGTAQYYRYDDRDRSLVCVSCPSDGTAPREAAPPRLNVEGLAQSSPGLTYVSDDGDLAFRTTEPLLPADQNTPPADRDQDPGTDIYEWRDGRLLLITDGFRDWLGANQAPQVAAISRSGRDVFFLAAAPLTPDAPDDYYRLYDARIGGGFEFPEPPSPCALEVCQGTPKGAPEEAQPGTSAFAGAGNVAEAPKARRCPKGKRLLRRGGKARCVKRRPAKRKRAKTRRANHERRAGR